MKSHASTLESFPVDPKVTRTHKDTRFDLYLYIYVCIHVVGWRRIARRQLSCVFLFLFYFFSRGLALSMGWGGPGWGGVGY